MAKISIIGGHGKIALRLTPLLVRAGHDVSAWIRSDSQTDDVQRAGATAVLVDVEQADVAAMTAALDGCDVLVWAAGAGGGSAARTYAVDRDAAIRSMQAAVKAHVGRYVMVSYFGASTDHGVPQDDAFFAYAEAKAAADEHLAGSGQAYTILGPSRLTDDVGTGRIEIPGATGTVGDDKSEVTRQDVAAVIAEVVQLVDGSSDALLDKTIEFNNGSAPIAEALRSL
ncbi:NAD(P)H-binding protein [Leekyejoonella antrihumi]|uniref:NAD-dependent epimerase/dehydratase family protein n=1 Tax=Leekyejoonella antrihumi TaxID=1660198 RepID=A0A563E131_9MICO|nr:NAD(P)H-binding protein [Leekyejoonella antrihumi]TWP36226.1 NAD-dependent epimerase/dehydratase family protein [Leekyejoonella antrihumi]